jgi:hypothetical protein
MAGFCECGNENSGSIICGGIAWLAEKYSVLKTVFAV